MAPPIAILTAPPSPAVGLFGSSIKPRSQIHILFDDKKLPTNNSFWLLARMVLKIVTNDVILPWRTFFAQFKKKE